MIATISLTRGCVSIIDEEDLPLISTRSWQAQIRRDRQGFYAVSDGVRMHRLLLGARSGEIVDHRNGDGLDNRRNNIRIGTQSGNCVNRQRTPGPHLRGARPRNGRWQAYIKLTGKWRSLGFFDTEIEAHTEYLAEAKRLHGDWMPFPEPPST